MAGNLGIAETAILGSSISWCLEHCDDVVVRLHSALPHEEQASGYQITSQGDNPRYWTAYAPGGTDPSRELWSGAGSLGVAHCIKACERHRSSNKDSSVQR
jgi:hypothetical protein